MGLEVPRSVSLREKNSLSLSLVSSVGGDRGSMSSGLE